MKQIFANHIHFTSLKLYAFQKMFKSFKIITLFLFHYPVTSEGFIEFNEVTSVLRNQPTVTAMYKTITTSTNKIISLTGNHLIYV